MNLKQALARLEQRVAPPLQLGGAVSYADPLDIVVAAIQGDPAVLTALALNPQQHGVRPDSRDHLFEVARALHLDAQSPGPPANRIRAVTVQTPEISRQDAPGHAVETSVALEVHPQAEKPSAPPPAPAEPAVPPWLSLMLAMAEDGGLNPTRGNLGVDVVAMDARPLVRECIVTPEMRKPGIIFIRTKMQKLVFHNGNDHFEVDPRVRQPLQAPSWLKDTPTWAYGLQAGFLEEV